jgi:branched-chain amino acid transport system ATP-binding protein/urea transport system ATP-binding protein
MLSVADLTSGYQDSRVLTGINLLVPMGRIVAILGRNGMGKTTLLRTIMGLVKTRGGHIRFDGRDLTGRKPYEISHAGIAYVPQGREIYNDFTVEENLLLGLIGKPKLAYSVPDRIKAYFPAIAERLGQRAGTLSGGQQQQLAIARALISKPRLLLLDEPSEGIQPSVVEQIGITLRQIVAEEGIAVLLVEQNVQMVLDTASLCLFLENGRVAEEQDIAEIRANGTYFSRYLGI